jgi:FkbM family methyltransferase
MLPVCIISFNNGRYVRNLVEQLCRINPALEASLWILDNCSTDPETLAYLETVPVRVIRNATNQGPWISPTQNAAVYAELPELFVLTDPDLELNPNLPPTFLDTLAELAVTHGASKLGLALDISDPSLFLEGNYTEGRTIAEHEAQFWTQRIPHPTYELYRAGLDTTFCVVNKRVYDTPSCHIRIAGDFTAKHIPWYKQNPLYTLPENYAVCSAQTHISTTSRLFLRYLEETHLKVTKHAATFFLEKRPSDPNLTFWTNAYPTWEPKTHRILEDFLRPDKVFLDIGGWIGTTCLYGSTLSRHVYVVEPDPLAFQDLQRTCSRNARNITCIERAIVHTDAPTVWFGKNRFRADADLNDSTSHLYDEPAEGCVQVQASTVASFLSTYSIRPEEVALIKVDIEGGEEHILADLYALHSTYGIPLYISFHIDWWTTPSLDRFPFLTPEQRASLKATPFGSLLFSSSGVSI